MSTYQFTARGIVDNAVLVLLVLAAGLCMWLANANKNLHETLAEERGRFVKAHRGDYLPSFDADVLPSSGRTARIGASESGQLLYFFKPDCRFCMQSAPLAERMYQHAKNANYQMYAVSLQDSAATRDYLALTKSKIPTVSVTDPRLTKLMRIGGVPALVGISKNGRISYVHYGVLTEVEVPRGSGATAPALAIRAPTH